MFHQAGSIRDRDYSELFMIYALGILRCFRRMAQTLFQTKSTLKIYEMENLLEQSGRCLSRPLDIKSLHPCHGPFDD